MAREFKRADRLGEQIQREVAELLQFHTREPLPGLVTVSGVSLTRDMGYADIHISVLGGVMMPSPLRWNELKRKRAFFGPS